MDRDYIVTYIPTGEAFRVVAGDGDYQTAKRKGAKAYLRRHPKSKYGLTSLIFSGKLKVRVVNDKRIKFEDFF